MANWEKIRDGYSLRDSKIHLSTLVLASHRRKLDERINTLREGFNRDPVSFLHLAGPIEMPRFVKVAGEYFGVAPENVAQTGSTTQGLGYIYSSIVLHPDDRILTTSQEFPATLKPLQARKRRHGTHVDELPHVFTHDHDPDAMVARLSAAITPQTRLLALTWVYSSTGFKAPIQQITTMVREKNAKRAPDRRILVCVDGVHGFGIENVTFDQLGCDFFVSGAHKWIYGPRGTGVIYGTKEALATLEPIVWTGMPHSPNGVHPYEHDFAVADAFEWLMSIGKDQIAHRVHGLATLLKDGLASIPGVRLLTPRSPDLSSGIVCCDVDGKAPDAVVKALADEYKIIATTSASDVLAPTKHVRFSPGIINDEEEIERALEAIEAIARS